ncbi:MAG: glycosyltransferase family 39 protein [Chloroflexota bacterium]
MATGVAAETTMARKRRAHARWESLALAAIVVSGFALRFYQIGFQSLWLDEAASVAFASGDPGYILRFTFYKEPNPPIYFLLLHFWMPLFGTSETAIRSLSAIAGSLSVPLLYVVGRGLFSPAAGLLGATAMALSPFHIWLSQETRGFTVLVFFGLVALYALLRALAGSERRWWVIYACAAFATMYVHLYGFILVGTYVVMALVLRRPERRWLGSLAVATAVPVILYVPWLLSLLYQFGEPQWRSHLSILEIVRQTLKTLPLGEENTWAFARQGWLVWVGLGACAVPLVARARSYWRGVAALLLWLGLPIVVSYLASFVSPIYAPRYLVIAAPALYLAIGVAIARVGSRVWPLVPVLLVALIATAWPVLDAAYHQPIKEDFRGATRYLQARMRPGDVAMIMAGYVEYGFLYYGLDGETPLGDVASREQVQQALTPFVAAHPRLWFVQSHYEFVDPQKHAETWLFTRCAKQGEKAFPGILVTELNCPSP